VLDLLESCLGKSEADYVEMRHHRREAFSVSVKDGRVEGVSNGVSEGTCARSLVEGSWGFSSTTILRRENVLEMLRDAESLARASKPKKRRLVNLAQIKPCVDKYETAMKTDPRREDLSRLLESALEADKGIREYSKSVVSDSVRLSVVDDELTFISSEGARITQRIVRCFGNTFAVAKHLTILWVILAPSEDS